jgi:UDP-2-acetamido-3-amino-2,3-dideoxy-glucuronate N-acetyltransferase
VLPFALVVGNPARQIGWMSEFGHRLNFDTDGFATCPESGQKYSINNNEVKKIN